jgi:hypothetical protein
MAGIAGIEAAKAAAERAIRMRLFLKDWVILRS